MCISVSEWAMVGRSLYIMCAGNRVTFANICVYIEVAAEHWDNQIGIISSLGVGLIVIIVVAIIIIGMQFISIWVCICNIA